MFNEEELERYARHIVLAEVGGAGQQKLNRAKVLVIGAGGLGSPVLQYLSAAGTGTIGIVDEDVVSLSNLQRQTIHNTDSIGALKTVSAAQAIERINPHTRIDQLSFRLNEENAKDVITQYDVVADGSDNFDTRYLVADICETLEKPLVTAAVGRFDGTLTTLTPFAVNRDGEHCPRYRDIFPEAPSDGVIPTCAEAGVLGALTGMLGTMQAMEVIKLITGVGEPLIGRLLMVDSKAMRFETVKYRRKR